MMNNRAIVLDMEATDVTKDAQATEIGWCDVAFDENGILNPVGSAHVQRCKPERPISFGSMAVTNIYEDQLVDEPSHNVVVPSVIDDSITYVIGHNIDYDMQVAANAGVTREYKRICTLAIALWCYPLDTDHKLLALLHMLDLDYARKYAVGAHSAKYDVMFCGRMLRILCRNNNITSMEQLYQFSEHCRIPVYMRFGKHKGKLISEIPYSYKSYMLTTDIDQWTRIAFERSIAEARSKRFPKKQKQKTDADKQTAAYAAAAPTQAATPPNTEVAPQPELFDDQVPPTDPKPAPVKVNIPPEQDDDFYKNPTKSDPFSRAKPADPLSTHAKKSDPYYRSTAPSLHGPD